MTVFQPVGLNQNQGFGEFQRAGGSPTGAKRREGWELARERWVHESRAEWDVRAWRR
jgi:hypothetical protein